MHFVCLRARLLRFQASCPRPSSDTARVGDAGAWKLLGQAPLTTEKKFPVLGGAPGGSASGLWTPVNPQAGWELPGEAYLRTITPRRAQAGRDPPSPNVTLCSANILGLSLPGQRHAGVHVGPGAVPESTTGVFWKAPIKNGH